MTQEPDFHRLAPIVCERLARNERVRRNLPGEGRLRIDRQLPFLCVYRRPADRDDPGARDLVTTEAAYLFTSGERRLEAGLAELCRCVSETLQEHFGAFLFLEIWTETPDAAPASHDALWQPAFEIVASDDGSLPGTLEVFQEALAEIVIDGRQAEVSLVRRRDVGPPGMTPLKDLCGDACRSSLFLGLAARPIWRDDARQALYPIVLQRLRRRLSRAMRRAIFALTGNKGAASGHFDSFGPSTMVKASRLVDQHLCDISESYDFLLQVTPVNAEPAWKEFADGRFREAPRLYYRPLPYDPNLLKRRLFEAPLERLEDPTLTHLFTEKHEELDRQLTALRDLGTSHFLYSSVLLYGKPDGELLDLAEQILAAPAGDAEQGDGPSRRLAAKEVSQRAREEIDFYRQRLTAFNPHLEVCDNIASGIMVAQDRLYISDSIRLPAHRLAPLLHHEVGTHLVTYFNGREQPLRQLFAGLAGYETLQEGLAVMAEHLVGGLTQGRLRTLAARVLAVQAMLDGRSFVEAFELLHRRHGLAAKTAFSTVLRAYRAGGLTKDIIYLRGLRDLLRYLAKGHEIEPLYVGKIALQHVPLIQELRRRGVIRPPALLPRFSEEAKFRDRLERSRGLGVLDLLETPP